MSYVPAVPFFSMLSSIGDEIAADRERQKQDELDSYYRKQASDSLGSGVVPPKPEGFLQRLTRTITGEQDAPAAPVAQPVPNAAPAPMPTPGPAAPLMAGTPAIVAEELKRRGHSPAAIAGILGNLKAESNFNTGAIGDNGTSGGLAQWHNERLAGLKNFAAQQGADWRDARVQTAYLDYELRNKEPRAFAALQAAQTPEEAAKAFIGFERPQGWSPNNPMGAMGAQQRVNNAIQLAGPLPASTGAKMADGYTNPNAPKEEVPPELRGFPSALQTLPGIMQAMRNPYMKIHAEAALKAYTRAQDRAADLEANKVTPLITPQDRAKYGIPADFAGVAYVDKNGAPHIQRFGPESSTTVNVAGEKAYETTVGKGYGETMLDLQKAGRSAPSSLSSLSLLEKAIDDPGFYSGSASDAVTAAKKAAVALGVSDAKDAAPNELFTKISNKLVLDLAGGSLGTGFSNADRDYLAGTVPNLGNSKEGNRQIIQIMKKVENRKAEVAKFARDYAKAHNGRLDEGFDDALSEWTDKNPLFKNEPPAAAPKLGSVPIPPERAAALKRHPDLRKEFDSQYGAGAAERILGPERKSKSAEPET